MDTHWEYKFYFQYHENLKLKFFSPQSDKKSSPPKEVKYEPFSFADGKWNLHFSWLLLCVVFFFKVKLLSFHMFFSGTVL